MFLLFFLLHTLLLFSYAVPSGWQNLQCQRYAAQSAMFDRFVIWAITTAALQICRRLENISYEMSKLSAVDLVANHFTSNFSKFFLSVQTYLFLFYTEYYVVSFSWFFLTIQIIIFIISFNSKHIAYIILLKTGENISLIWFRQRLTLLLVMSDTYLLCINISTLSLNFIIYIAL